MATSRDENGILMLVREPIWMRQSGESEANHTAFMAYVNADGNMTMGAVSKQFGVSLNVMRDDQWRERAEHFWSEVDQQVNDAIGRRLMKLREFAVEGAITLAQEHETVEASKRTRTNPRTGKVLYQDETITRRKLAPNSFVVNKVLDNVLNANADSVSGTETLSAIFQAMVSSTFKSDEGTGDAEADDE